MAPIKKSFFGGYNKRQTDEEFAKLREQYEKEISGLKKSLEDKENENRSLKERNDKLTEDARYIPQALVFVKDKADSIVRDAKSEYEKNLAAYKAEKDFLEDHISRMREYLVQALNQAVEAADRMSSQMNIQINSLTEHEFENRILSDTSSAWGNADGGIVRKLEAAVEAAEKEDSKRMDAETIADMAEKQNSGAMEAEEEPQHIPEVHPADEQPADTDGAADYEASESDVEKWKALIRSLGGEYPDAEDAGTDAPSAAELTDKEYLKELIDELIEE